MMLTTLETTGSGVDAWQLIVGIAALVFFTGYALQALVPLRNTAHTVAVVTGIAAAFCAVALLIDLLH